MVEARETIKGRCFSVFPGSDQRRTGAAFQAGPSDLSYGVPGTGRISWRSHSPGRFPQWFKGSRGGRYDAGDGTGFGGRWTKRSGTGTEGRVFAGSEKLYLQKFPDRIRNRMKEKKGTGGEHGRKWIIPHGILGRIS